MDIAFDLKIDMVRDIIVTSSEKKQGADRVIDLMEEICRYYYEGEEEEVTEEEFARDMLEEPAEE